MTDNMNVTLRGIEVQIHTIPFEVRNVGIRIHCMGPNVLKQYILWTRNCKKIYPYLLSLSTLMRLGFTIAVLIVFGRNTADFM